MGVRPSYFELDDMLQRFESVFGAGAIRPTRYDAGGVFDSRRLVFDSVGVPAPVLRATTGPTRASRGRPCR